MSKKFSHVQALDLSEQTPRAYLLVVFGLWNYVDEVERTETELIARNDGKIVLRTPVDAAYLVMASELGRVITDEEATRQGALRQKTTLDILKSIGVSPKDEKTPTGQYL